MGSLFSAPSVPTTPYYTSYTPTPSPSSSDTPSTGSGISTTGDNGDDANRIAAIMRKRTFPGTIQTSWRGVLQTGDWMPQRKSLLGE